MAAGSRRKTVEVVRNHVDGTLDGNWRSHPEGSALERKREGRARR
jgi:hypothetical protein